MENLEQLIAENQGSLFAFLYRMCGDPALAEELMQETFVRALRAAKRYRPEGKISTWLFSIAANLLRDRWRRQTRRGVDLPLEDDSAEVPSTEDVVLEHVSLELVHRALLTLAPEVRSAFILRYYHDQSYEEIARTLACPLGTVRSRIHNGLRRLRRTLAEEVAADEQPRNVAAP